MRGVCANFFTKIRKGRSFSKFLSTSKGGWVVAIRMDHTQFIITLPDSPFYHSRHAISKFQDESQLRTISIDEESYELVLPLIKSLLI